MKLSFTHRFQKNRTISLLAGIAVLLALATATLHAATEQLYTCGMHPQIIKKEPGNCPICEMKLTPIRANVSTPAGASSATHGTDSSKGGMSSESAKGERSIKYYKSTMTPGEIKPGPGKDSMGMDMVPVYEDEDNSTSKTIQIDGATTQRMNLKTALVTSGPVRREVRANGIVAYDESRLRDITTKYEGWIEKLHVDTTWAPVSAGAPLFEIYSPDLHNALLNYALAYKTEGTDGPLTRSALARLQLLDVSPDIIEQTRRMGEPARTHVFNAPSNGVVIEKMAVLGQMVKAGERIYRIADLSSVWVDVRIYEKDAAFVREGQPVKIRSSYGAPIAIDGVVRQILPQIDEQTRALVARVVVPNPDGRLRPGMFAEATLTAQLSSDAVLVPDIAVLRSGEHNTVFVVLNDGYFEPREVKLGARSEGNFYEVLNGLKAGERVVTSGQFMLDSESQLREAIQKMLRSAEAESEAKPQPQSPPVKDAPASAHQH